MKRRVNFVVVIVNTGRKQVLLKENVIPGLVDQARPTRLIARMLDQADCRIRVVTNEVHIVSSEEAAARGSASRADRTVPFPFFGQPSAAVAHEVVKRLGRVV